MDDENGFQKRVREGVVDWNKACGTCQCLWGWYEQDVLGLSMGPSQLCAHFGFKDIVRSFPIFGAESSGDIHARRAALLAHIERLEAKEKVAA